METRQEIIESLSETEKEMFGLDVESLARTEVIRKAAWQKVWTGKAFPR